MSGEPQTWHYGLMAERWGLIDDAPELPFLQRAVERFGQPVLDLACGAGRLTVPLRASGIDIDGCDISQDMLEQAAARAARAGVNATLFQGQMHTFEPPRRYRTIFICDSFGLGAGRAEDLDALRRIRDTLEEDGALIVNIDAEYGSAESWQMWVPGHRPALPEPWPTEGSSRVAPDGTEHVAYFRLTQFDPLEQTLEREVRLEKRQAGALVASEQYTLRGNLYFKPELQLMLETVGFRDVSVTGDWSMSPATPESQKLVFTALR